MVMGSWEVGAAEAAVAEMGALGSQAEMAAVVVAMAKAKAEVEAGQE